MLEDCLLPSAAELEGIARETRLIQRASHKFSATGFLLAVLQSVTKGDTSLNHLVMHLAAFANRSMTRQALWQPFSEASSAFFLKVIHRVIERRHPEAADVLQHCPFGRVIVEDSTVISMAKSNASDLPNNGNGRHETAGCKCLLSLDILRGRAVDFQLHAAREADQSLIQRDRRFRWTFQVRRFRWSTVIKRRGSELRCFVLDRHHGQKCESARTPLTRARVAATCWRWERIPPRCTWRRGAGKGIGG